MKFLKHLLHENQHEHFTIICILYFVNKILIQIILRIFVDRSPLKQFILRYLFRFLIAKHKNTFFKRQGFDENFID